MEQSKVSIDLKEYNEFVISQYENGKIKTSLLDSIKTLKKDLVKLELGHDAKLELNRSFKFKKDIIIELVFKRYKMGSDTRSEQTDMIGDYFGNYTGVNKNNVSLLEEIGISKDEIVAYINIQWDIKDAADKVEKEAAEEKARLDAAIQKEETK